jgi:lipoate-protein ligase A
LNRTENKNVDLEQLSRHSLVMSNDVIIIGELKGREANSFFDSISTGHTGLATVHADSVRNTIDRLITLIKKDVKAQYYTEEFLRRFLSSSVDYIIFMKDFKFILSNQTNPQFNIASEEYLLKQTDGFYVYLWRNLPSVIVGLNQNTLLEVNLKKANEKGIQIVRRLTGGGAVYHDLENVCYTIIAPYKNGEDYYEKFTKPVIEYLNNLGVPAKFTGRNDITIDNKKISGNAQVIYKDRILHHGTILFNTNLDALQSVLIQNDIKMILQR